MKAFVPADKQKQLASLTQIKPALVIPKIPFVAIPAKVAAAFPELASWHTANHAQMEAWRVETNVVVTNLLPPP